MRTFEPSSPPAAHAALPGAFAVSGQGRPGSWPPFPPLVRGDSVTPGRAPAGAASPGEHRTGHARLGHRLGLGRSVRLSPSTREQIRLSQVQGGHQVPSRSSSGWLLTATHSGRAHRRKFASWRNARRPHRLRPESLGREDEMSETDQKPFSGTLRVESPSGSA
jgi:hypothetical protein